MREILTVASLRLAVGSWLSALPERSISILIYDSIFVVIMTNCPDTGFCKRCSFLLLLLFFFTIPAFADSTLVVQTSKISSIYYLNDADIAFTKKNNNIDITSFKHGISNRGRIQPNDIGRDILLRFKIHNDTDTVTTFYFFPGYFFDSTAIVKLSTDTLRFKEYSNAPDLPMLSSVQLTSEPLEFKDNRAFFKLRLHPGETSIFIATITQVKTYNNRIAPRLIHPLYLEAHLIQLHNSNHIESITTYIFCGLLAMMILFSLATYAQGGSKEFLYYAGYAFFLGAMLFTKPYFNLRSNSTTFFFEAYFDFIMQCIGICFYMAFMQGFLSTRKNHPFLHKLYQYGIAGLLVAMVVFTALHYGTDGFVAQNIVENYITKGALLLMVVIFLVYARKHWDDKLMRFLFWGNFLYLLCSMISLALILAPVLRTMLPGLFKSALLYYELGLFIELAFFLVALSYKNRRQLIEQTKERERLRMENQRKEMEKQLAVLAAHQDERARISADMHDELGSGMTTIRLMSEIAKNKMKDQVPTEIEKISHSANDLLNKMNAIIWSMNSGNDTVDNLVSYIRAYALEYLDGTQIQCKVNTPEHIPYLELSGDKRRNLFLCVKETLNNSLKHSRATEMTIDIEVDHSLRITITDNGIGIDKNNQRQFGNGLRNISKRMETIGGTFEVNGERGTVTRLELPL